MMAVARAIQTVYRFAVVVMPGAYAVWGFRATPTPARTPAGEVRGFGGGWGWQGEPPEVRGRAGVWGEPPSVARALARGPARGWLHEAGPGRAQP